MTARTVLDRTMTEAELQVAVIELARLRGWLIHHDRGDYRQCIAGDPGFPDLVLARRGQVIFAELKTERGNPTKRQATWFEHLPQISWYLWRPRDWSTGRIARALA